MSELQLISLILLTLVITDAAGDALRARSNQWLHHFAEAFREGIWLALLVYYTGVIEYVPIYILGRIAFFDPLFNIIKGNKLSYIGKSSIYGKVLTWFTNLESIREPGFLIWVIRALCLVALIILFLTK